MSSLQENHPTANNNLPTSKTSAQTERRREYLLGLFDYVEKLQPYDFRASTRAAFELGLRNGTFDDGDSWRGNVMESELLASIGRSAAVVMKARKR